MTNKVTEFEQTMERYEEGARERRQRDAAEALLSRTETERQQAIFNLNIRRRQTRNGTIPKEVLSEEDAAICETFIERMRKQNFPGATVLKNEIVNESTARRFYRRLLGQRPKIEPFSIRGYQLGVAEALVGIVSAQRRVYLCEDARLRALGVTRLTSNAGSLGDSEEHRVHDLSYDPRTGRLAEIIPVASDTTYAEYGEVIVYSIEDMLLQHMMSDDYVRAQAD